MTSAGPATIGFPVQQVAAKRTRDVRLDFFRGLCLVIIFISHIYANPWADWIPAKFGFSDATEIFVFCSGMASAVAFGGAYRNRGFLLGTARVLFRCWQVYWAHIGLFLVVAAAMVIADNAVGGGEYVKGLQLDPLFGAQAKAALVGLVTLTYVPNYFDILPMYLVILLVLPVVMALKQRLGLGYVIAFVGVMWLLANLGLARLPAEPWGERSWYFNPFGWQLVFFTGFALMAGWIPAPPVNRRLVWSAGAFVALTVPLAWWPALQAFSVLSEARAAIQPLADKSGLGILRYVHFMALAYLAFAASGENGCRLRGPVVEMFRRLGQQSLAIFMAGLLLSFVMAILLDQFGRTLITVPLANLGGVAIMFAVARTAAWFKSQPWQGPARVATSATISATAPKALAVR